MASLVFCFLQSLSSPKSYNFNTNEYFSVLVFNTRRPLLYHCNFQAKKSKKYMDPSKQSNDSQDSSSTAETDHQMEKSCEDNTGVGRSYECTFCKRGFTNAQALGGHMNIHRKDKAKAKTNKNKIQEDPSLKSNPTMSSMSVPQRIPSIDQLGYYGVVGSPLRNYQVYLPCQNPSFHFGNTLPIPRPEQFVDNLSLRIGLNNPPEEADHGDGNVKENEVDLELRLGHDP